MAGFVVRVPAKLAHVAKHVVQAETIRPFFAARMSLVTGVATKPAILSQTGRIVAKRVARRCVRKKLGNRPHGVPNRLISPKWFSLAPPAESDLSLASPQVPPKALEKGPLLLGRQSGRQHPIDYLD